MSIEFKPPPRPLQVERSIEDYASALAYVRIYGDRGEVLESLGVSASTWEHAQNWMTKMSRASFDGNEELVDRFAAAFSRTFEVLRAEVEEERLECSGDVGESRRGISPTRGMSAVEASNAAAGHHLLERADFDSARSDDATSSSPADEGDGLGTTLSIEVLRPVGAALPFVSPPTLSVDQYASICASLEAFPDKQDIIWTRYGISDRPHFSAIQDAFAAYFERAPAAREAFTRRLADALGRIRGGG